MPHHHIVLMKFKPQVASEQIAELWRFLAELQHLIPGITTFSGGPNTSPEALAQGYTHGFLITFESARARDAYLPHPEHLRVKAQLSPCLDRVLVFDWEAG